MKQMFRGVASENIPDGNILAETNLLTDHNKGDGAGEGVGLSQLAPARCRRFYFGFKSLLAA